MRRKNSSADAYHSFSSRQQQMRHDDTYSAPRSVRVRARGGPLLRTVVRCLLRYYQLITSVACVCNNYGVTSHGVSCLSVNCTAAPRSVVSNMGHWVSLRFSAFLVTDLKNRSRNQLSKKVLFKLWNFFSYLVQHFLCCSFSAVKKRWVFLQSNP